MLTGIDNLWGDLPPVESFRTPLTILREQATILTEITNRNLEGSVQVFASTPSNVQAGLFIVAPSLGGYRIEIVRISYGLDIYPVGLQDMLIGASFTSVNEENFIGDLSGILRSDKVRKVLTSLIGQIKSDNF